MCAVEVACMRIKSGWMAVANTMKSWHNEELVSATACRDYHINSTYCIPI